jgi:hypothetical protein
VEKLIEKIIILLMTVSIILTSCGKSAGLLNGDKKADNKTPVASSNLKPLLLAFAIVTGVLHSIYINGLETKIKFLSVYILECVSIYAISIVIDHYIYP